MLRFYQILFIGVLLIGLGYSGASAEELVQPIVVATTPTLGARDVDPNLKAIQVRFNVPMANGRWSWCGGGGDYPEISGKIHFADEYTAVMPVKLEPQKTYMLSINCRSGRNFVSAQGVPAEVTPFRFTTGSGGKFIAAHAKNYESWKEFRRLFDEVYSYRDRLGIDWNTIFDENQDWVLSAPNTREWISRVTVLIAAAKDIHLYVRDETGRRISSYSSTEKANINWDAVQSMLPDLKEHNPIVYSTIHDGVGYLAIHSWDNAERQMDVIQDILEEMKELPSIVIDVRGNGGGVENEAIRVASWFVRGERIYAKSRYRDPESESGWTPDYPRSISGDAYKRFDGKVIVLQGPACYSSNEAFLLMMKCAEKAVLMGEASGGSSANPRGFPLANGTTIVIPRWQALRADGTCFEGEGIAPDVEFSGEYTYNDPLLKEAFNLAKSE